MDLGIYLEDDLSSDEETLLADIETLKAYERKAGSSRVEAAPINGATDALRLISEGLADVASTTSNVLVLNRLIICTLKQMESQVENQLKLNAFEQEETKAKIQILRRTGKPIHYARVQQCGMPFFNVDGWLQEENEYVRIQESRGYCSPEDHFQMAYVWSTNDNRKLLKLVQQNSKDMKITKIEQKIKEIKGKSENLTEWYALQNECEQINNCNIDENIDWLRVATSMSLEVSPLDCEYQWKYVVDPRTNQSPWKLDETSQLHKVAKANYFQSWDKIASQLGTNRSPLMCCHKFQRSFPKNVGFWTISEDEKLMELFQHFSFNNHNHIFSKVAILFTDRNVFEVRQRLRTLTKKTAIGTLVPASQRTLDNFLNLIPTKSVRKVQAKYQDLLSSDNEIGYETDILLVRSVAVNGTNWDQVVQRVPGITKEMARKRYQQLVKLLQEVANMAGLKRESMRLIPEWPNQDTLNALSLLKFLKRPDMKRCGLNFENDVAVKGFLELLTHANRHAFGPRYKMPRKTSEYISRGEELITVCNALQITVNATDVTSRLTEHIDKIGNDYDANVSLSVLVKMFKKPLFANQSPNYLRMLMAPNILTLVGMRSLLQCRPILTAQASLPLTANNGTLINRNIPEEDRLEFGKAKELFKSRMHMLFYLSALFSKFSPIDKFKVPVATSSNKSRAAKPKSRLKRKQQATKMCQARWKRHKGPTEEIP